jgi:putative ABC transport system substrate-binding protein
MKRREFITLLGGAAAWPLASRAQPRAVPVIGYLSAVRPDSAVAAFRAGLAETGYVEGRNVAIEFRSMEGRIDRAPALAADLVRRQVAMIMASGAAAAHAAKSATTTIPIVFAIGGDPIGDGLVASLNHPGANSTGATWLLEELIGKRMEVLHEIVPAAATIGYLLDPTGPFAEAETKDAETAARALGVQLAFLNASTPSQIETAFTTLVERRIGALTIGAGPFLGTQYEHIVRLAALHGMARDLPVSLFRQCRRSYKLRTQSGRCVSRGRYLCGPHSQWREAGRLTGPAGNENRADHQPQDRQGPRPRRPINAARPGRRGDRVGCLCLLHCMSPILARLGITDPGQTGPVVGAKQPPPRSTRSDAIDPNQHL